MVSYREQNLLSRKILAWFLCYQNRISSHHPKSLSFERMKYNTLGRLYTTENPNRRTHGYEMVINTIMIAGGRYSDTEWKNIVLHELCHAIRGDTRHHDMLFRKTCRRMGVAREFRGRSLQ
jgi:hypothetical protein